MIIFIPLIFWGLTSCCDIKIEPAAAAVVLVASKAIVAPPVAFPLVTKIEDLVIVPASPATVVPETNEWLGSPPNRVLAVMRT